MTYLVDGELQPDGLGQTTDDGAFDRVETTFRDRIGSDERSAHPLDPDRYHLYVSRACPWAHGTVLVRNLLGLEDAITVDIVDPFRDDRGWQFSPDRDDCTPDTINDSDYLYQVYTAADPEYTGKVSVPVLWDKEVDTIVNNESIEIMRMLTEAFGDRPAARFDLYPPDLREAIDGIVDDLYEPINNGVYRAGFARSQSAYDEAVTELFAALDRWDQVLDEQRYLAGETLTLADIRLFPTLVRFDHVYHTHFMCNRRRIVDYPNLWNHTKEVYQLPGVPETVNMAHIKEHYYTTHDGINPHRLVAVGPDLDFTEPHDRDRLPAAAPEP